MFPLLAGTVWFFVGLVVVVAGIYATGMVITRRKLGHLGRSKSPPAEEPGAAADDPEPE